MDASHFSAFAALAGSMIGGLTVSATSWLTLRVQLRSQRLEHEITRLEEIYRAFIEEASKLFADAYEHNEVETSKLVNLYALVSMMRVLSSPTIIEKADNVMRLIIETYFAPNKSFRDVQEMLDKNEMDPLREFSVACREELLSRRSS